MQDIQRSTVYENKGNKKRVASQYISAFAI